MGVLGGTCFRCKHGDEFAWVSTCPASRRCKGVPTSAPTSVSPTPSKALGMTTITPTMTPTVASTSAQANEQQLTPEPSNWITESPTSVPMEAPTLVPAEYPTMVQGSAPTQGHTIESTFPTPAPSETQTLGVGECCLLGGTCNRCVYGDE